MFEVKEEIKLIPSPPPFPLLVKEWGLKVIALSTFHLHDGGYYKEVFCYLLNYKS